jgi:anti-sigma factor RsiW
MDGMIMACNRTAQVHRYHDGELVAAERQSVEVHLRDCSECRATLAEFRGLSELLASVPRRDMPAGLMGRLLRSRTASLEQGVLRAAAWMTAAAAAVLFGTLLTWPADSVTVATRPPVWQTAAVMSPADVRDDTNADQIVMAQWMADELSSGAKGELR